METMLRVLLIEDSEDDAILLKRALTQGGYDTVAKRVYSADQMRKALGEEMWDVVLSDYVIPGFGALEALKILKQSGHDLPFIIVSGQIDEEIAVHAMKAGAHDFITKGNLIRLIPVVSRELAEAELRFKHRTSELARINSEQKYRHLAESITDVFFALDLHMRCIYWNKAAEKLTGISIKSALSRNFNDLFPDNTGKQIEHAIQEALSNQKTTAILSSVQKEDMTSHFEVNIYPTENGLSVLAKDITERKRAEDLQKVQEEMKEQLAQGKELHILGQLTSGVAHEVRNPLNAISVVLEALFQDLGDKPDFLPYKEHVFTHVDRLKRLMQDLLELGKPIERSKVTILSLLEVIKETVSVWRSSGIHRDFEVVLEADEDEKYLIKGDPLKLQQVFMNLLENASQHSPAGTEISIILARAGNECNIQVVDRGNGVKPEYMDFYFEPFFTTRKKGTGLGLAIVKHIVDVHGGTISIRNSEPSPGCTVEIVIPLV